MTFPLGGGRSVSLDDSVRLAAVDTLFQDDADGDSLQRLVLEALTRSPIDMRRSASAGNGKRK